MSKTIIVTTKEIKVIPESADIGPHPPEEGPVQIIGPAALRGLLPAGFPLHLCLRQYHRHVDRGLGVPVPDQVFSDKPLGLDHSRSLPADALDDRQVQQPHLSRRLCHHADPPRRQKQKVAEPCLCACDVHSLRRLVKADHHEL